MVPCGFPKDFLTNCSSERQRDRAASIVSTASQVLYNYPARPDRCGLRYPPTLFSSGRKLRGEVGERRWAIVASQLHAGPELMIVDTTTPPLVG